MKMWSCAEYINWALFLKEIYMYSKYEKTRVIIIFKSLVHYIQVLNEKNVIIIFINLVFQIWAKTLKHKIYISTIKNK